MSDIYNIPGDDGKKYRLKKFVEYQHEVPSIHYRFLGEYIKRHSLSKDDAVNMCFLMLITYNEITCLLLYRLLERENHYQIWGNYKEQLLFGSARKYAKNNDQFCGLIDEWERITCGKPYNWLKAQELSSEVSTYRNVQRSLLKMNNVGRFASDLFLEMVVYLKDYLGVRVTEPTEIDWVNCANLTSGIYNIFYEDERANEFDRTKKVSEGEKRYLSSRLRLIQSEIQKTYPEQDAEISLFIGKICSFRNLFKNARYGGFHHDRQLGVIREYEKTFPEYKQLWDECYSMRAELFPRRFLGELNGWSGIRKERKKIWLTTGRTGAEPLGGVDER